MGNSCSVGIEPDEQTRLADATESLPGVLCAGVPGAGGEDAIYALVILPEGRDTVEQMWSTWEGGEGEGEKRVERNRSRVCPLMLSSEEKEGGGRGIRREEM
jgi:hypothetical protein